MQHLSERLFVKFFHEDLSDDARSVGHIDTGNVGVGEEIIDRGIGLRREGEGESVLLPVSTDFFFSLTACNAEETHAGKFMAEAFHHGQFTLAVATEGVEDVNDGGRALQILGRNS